jgi:serine/threonine protein kinase
MVVGPPSDIFSLGSVLVYAATGRAPFKTGQAFEIFHQVIYGQPDVSDVPTQIRPLIMRCLNKDPKLRPSTDQILADLGPQPIEASWLPASFGEIVHQYDLRSLRGRGLSSSATVNQPIRARISLKAISIAGHAFLSYVREDSRQVDELQRILERAGVPVWRDTADLWPGEDWRTKIRHAITNNALVFIACFSQASISRYKSYQNEELTLAIEQMRMRSPDDPWLIPVRLNECEIPDREIGAGRTLASIQRADLFGDSAEEGSERLVAAILRILGRNSGFPR